MTLRKVEFLKSATKPKHFPEGDIPEIVFAGRSNVGKSS
ncbi:MAG: YihA family ribosome biogenesis GTP-binding protein, partial [Aggregatilineales bacterium]